VRILAAVPGHVEWFEDPSRYPVDWSLVFSVRTLLAVAAGLAAIAILAVAQRLLRDPHWPRLPFLSQMAIGAPALLAVQAAIPLIYSGVQPVLFAPQMRLEVSFGGVALGALEVVIGFCFLTGLFDRLASIALVALLLAAFFFFQPLDVLAQLHLAGIAIVIFVIGRQAPDAARPRLPGWWNLRLSTKTAVAWLRICTGVAVIAPALSEKLWNPAIAEAFLRQHPNFNFAHYYLGISWMSDDRFILAAGIVELVIGGLLITGVLTRVVIIAMWLPFNATIPFLPPQELLYHLPFFGIMYFLLVHGANLVPGNDPLKAGRRNRAAPQSVPT
jgi:uncharacterized membrane protein YphA (DoxX/SURF4 family)